VACAAALANLAIIERENLVQNAEAMGARLHAAIAARVRDCGIVGEVRSRGLMVAVDFADPARRDRPLAREHVASLNTRALDRGYIAMAKDSVLRLAPPLCISAAEVDELAHLVGETVRELQDEVTRSTRGRVAAAY
jgi:L-2,4-diaminobutyrate transaminase